MPVNYYLRPNKLGKDGKTYMANVISTGTVGPEDIIKEMLRRGSTVTRADIVSVLSDYHDSIESFLHNGANVKHPWQIFHPVSEEYSLSIKKGRKQRLRSLAKTDPQS